MRGDTLRQWFDTFTGVAVSTMTKDGPDSNDGWVEHREYRKIIEQRGAFKINGVPYDPNSHRFDLERIILSFGRALCRLKVLQRRDRVSNDGPHIEFKPTKLGRHLMKLGYGPHAEFRQKAFFFLGDVYLTILNKWKAYAVAVGVIMTITHTISLIWITIGWYERVVTTILISIIVLPLVWLYEKLGSAD